MNNFGLILCLDKDAGAKPAGNRLSRAVTAVWDRVTRTRIEIGVEKIELSEGLSCRLIRLPYTLDELKTFKGGRLRKIEKLVSTVLSRMEAALPFCLMPPSLSGILRITGCMENPFTGRFLFKSLLPLILSELCRMNHVMPFELEVSVICGSCDPETFDLIRVISPCMKYVRVVTADKAPIEAELDILYGETGLSIGVTVDCTGAFKSSDLVLNLRSLKEFGNFTCFGSRALVLNLGDPDAAGLRGDNILINGVELMLPQALSRRIGREAIKQFGRQAVAEMILAMQCGCQTEISQGKTDPAITQRMLKLFGKEGYKITGFIGRHGLLKKDDIIFKK